MRQIHVRDYGIIPGDEKETTLKLRKMLQEIRQEENLEIRFEKGIYHFYPDYAGEKLLYISNHDEDTIKKVAFDLSGMKQVKISGTDTQFLFHTDILPFHIDRCREICIEGITIDYARTGYSEGKIVKVTDKKMLLEINQEEYPYRIIHGNIFFEEENGLLNCIADVWKWMPGDVLRYTGEGISVSTSHTRLPMGRPSGKKGRIWWKSVLQGGRSFPKHQSRGIF